MSALQDFENVHEPNEKYGQQPFYAVFYLDDQDDAVGICSSWNGDSTREDDANEAIGSNVQNCKQLFRGPLTFGHYE